MNTMISTSILILALSVAFVAFGVVNYLLDLDDLVRQICLRMEAKTAKVKREEYERGRSQGRKDFAVEIDSLLDVYLFGNDIKYTYQVKHDLEKRIAEELRK